MTENINKDCENQKTEIPESVMKQVISQYKPLGVGYRNHDPELQEARSNLGKVVKFLSGRCRGDSEIIALMHKVADIHETMETFRKIPDFADEHHPNGLFEIGYSYWHQEVQAIFSNIGRLGGKG